MAKNIKISVIIPVYNVEKYIRQCLESIINQTYKNLEIIIVNDGTKDNSMRIIGKYLSDERIKVINKENEGLALARNRGIEEATGEYISFIDSDDWLELDAYEKLIEIIEDEDIIAFNYNRVDDKTQKILKKNYINMEEILKLPQEYTYLYSELEDMCCIKLYKTKYIKKNNFKFMKVIHEDFFWKVETIYSTNKIKVLDEALYNYRINREDNIMNLEKKEDVKTLEYRKKSYEIILGKRNEYIKENEKSFSLGQKIYVRIERENWRIKLNGELFFEELDNYLKRYLKETNNLIEKKIIIKRLKDLLKSRDTQKIVGINYYDIFYLKNRIFDFDFFRKRLKNTLVHSKK